MSHIKVLCKFKSSVRYMNIAAGSGNLGLFKKDPVISVWK